MPIFFIEMELLLTFCLHWPPTAILSMFTSQVSGITGMSKHIQPPHPLFFELGHLIPSSPTPGLRFTTLAYLVLRPLSMDWNTPVWRGLQLADGISAFSVP
jgi:hypothetical protein